MTARTSTKGKPTEESLTADRLRAVLNYDPETGGFTWRVTGRGIAFLGAPAGTKSDSGSGKIYLKIRVDGRLYFAHRLAWLWLHGEWPTDQIDHRDGNGQNNSEANLRPSNQTQNLGNVGRRSFSKEKYKGITKHGAQWLAQICHEGNSQYLGLYDDPVSAAKAYDLAAMQKFGSFAKTNQSLGLL